MYTILVMHKGGERVSDDYCTEEPMTADLLYQLRAAGHINDYRLREYLALLGPIDETRYAAFYAARNVSTN